MSVVTAIFENDIERDRKICVSLDQKVSGANRELAQWLMDHPRYSGDVVAAWLGCAPSRVRYLRAWAKRGFEGSPFNDETRKAWNQRRLHEGGVPLKSNDNFEDDTFEPDNENVEEPRQVLTNLLDSIKQYRAVAEAYRKILKRSPFDREAKKEISDAIESLIRKLRSIQSTLATRGKAHVEQDN